MYSPSTMAMTLDLVSLCNKYMKSLPKTMNANTVKAKQHFCNEILKTWGNIEVADLKVFQVQEFLEERIKKCSVNSFNVYKKHGAALFNFAFKQQLLPPGSLNVFEAVDRKPHVRKKRVPAPVDDVLEVLSVATEDQKNLLMVYLLTGARKSEILDMVWDDIDFENRTFLLHTKKSGTGLVKTTKHEMSDHLYDLFQTLLQKRHPKLQNVFWHRYYSKIAGKDVDEKYTSINKMTRRLCKKAGVEHFTLHQLRHLAATILKVHGHMSISQLQLFLRHDNQKTTEIYAGFLDGGTQEQGDFLGEFWSEKLQEVEGADTGG